MCQSATDRILKAALELFSEHGYTDVTTRSIAAEARVNEVTLFRLFGTKKALYIEVFDRFSVKPGPDFLNEITHDLKHDLQALGRAFVQLYTTNVPIVKMSIFAIISEVPEVQTQLGQQVRDLKEIVSPYFASMHERGRLAYDPTAIADLFVDMLFGHSSHLERAGRLNELPETIARLTEVFAVGVATPPR